MLMLLVSFIYIIYRAAAQGNMEALIKLAVAYLYSEGGE